VSRLTKSSTLEVLHEDYVRTARAKGLNPRDVISRHVLRNALVPVITVITVQFGRLLGGVVIIESVFAWPGLGRLLLSGVNGRDYLIVQNGMVVLIFVFAVINLLTDIIYSIVDPRIRLGQSEGR
jgi:peptide/nickel transport system permease protein